MSLTSSSRPLSSDSLGGRSQIYRQNGVAMSLYRYGDGGYAPYVSDPQDSRRARRVGSEAASGDRAHIEVSEDSSVVGSVSTLRQQHPELDWNDPESALETLAILSDPEAMADLEEAEHDIATGNLLPLDRYAPPS